MAPLPRIAATGNLLASPGRYALLEPLVLLLAAILFVVGLEIGKQRPDFLRGRRWAWFLYLVSKAALLVTAASPTHDWLYPSKAFRDFAIRVGETALVLGFPVLFWVSLREKDRIGVIATWSYGGFTGRSIPSMIGLCWWVFAALFDVSALDGGGYAVQSVDEVCEQYQGKTLEAVIRMVAGTGIRNARYTWQRRSSCGREVASRRDAGAWRDRSLEPRAALDPISQTRHSRPWLPDQAS